MWGLAALLLCSVCTLCVLLRVTVATPQELIIKIVPDPGYQNDVVWRLEKVDENNDVIEVLDLGTGAGNKLQTKVRLSVDETDCLRFNLTDLWGDGFNGNSRDGQVDVYFGDSSVDTDTPTETLFSYAFSDTYLESGRGGQGAGSAIYYLQDGVEALGGCNFNFGCHESTAVDVVFVLDTASELSFDCQNFYFPAIVQLVEHYLPRDDLKISIVTYGVDDAQRQNNVYAPIIKTPLTTGFSLTPRLSFDANGNWETMKAQILDMGASQCLGGGHATITAINESLSVFTNTYGTNYDLTRQQYMLLFTNDQIDVDETKNIYDCEYLRQVIVGNGVDLILLSETPSNIPPAANLTCLLSDRPANVLDFEFFSKLDEQFEQVQSLVCSANFEVVITEIFIDDDNSRWWIELVNVGLDLNVTDLIFSGTLFAGSVDDSDQRLIEQGDVFVIGNMGDAAPTYTPCEIYFGITTDIYDCSNYFSVSYSGAATRDDFTIQIDNNRVSNLVVSSSALAEAGLAIATGYSYELPVVYADWSNLTNWRESCYQYGGPGLLGPRFCAQICDPIKCSSYGDTAADCAAVGCTTVTRGTPFWIGDYAFCLASQCSCTLNYYYDAAGTRACTPVIGPVACEAYVTDQEQGTMQITWSESPLSTMVTEYRIWYANGAQQDTLTAQGQEIDDPAYSVYRPRVSAVGVDPSDGHVIESVATQCSFDFAPTRRPTVFGETWEPTAMPTQAPVTTALPTLTPTNPPTYGGCELKVDVAFVFDQSGSVYNSDPLLGGGNLLANWWQEINFATAIVNRSLPVDTRVAAFKFSGCSLHYTFERCRDTTPKMQKLWGFNDYGFPNNLTQVYDALVDESNFTWVGGYTWTDAALTMALNEFIGNGTEGRKKILILVTDGKPEPIDEITGYSVHDPCRSSTGYVSPTLRRIREEGIEVIAVGVDVEAIHIEEFFKCIVDDFDTQFFYASDFTALDSLSRNVGDLICSDVELIINEVGLLQNCTGNGETLFFIELYNEGIGVNLQNFRFEGMINYNITEPTFVEQGQYWVISTYDMDFIDQDLCRNCSQDLLVSPSHADTNMDDISWDLWMYNGNGDLIDVVIRQWQSFPIVDKCFTHELQYEHLDNFYGGNWEESCFVYGTPQSPNQEPCPCSLSKCIEKGDTSSYCGQVTNYYGQTVVECICSEQYLLSGGVCIPVFPPESCVQWEHDCANNLIYLTWNEPASSSVSSYRVYLGNVTFLTVDKSVRRLKIEQNASLAADVTAHVLLEDDCGANCLSVQAPYVSCGAPFAEPASNFSVTTIFQDAPLIESDKESCPFLPPTEAPTQEPTQQPTTPTLSPTMSPTASPTFSPTAFCCDYLYLYITPNVSKSAGYNHVIFDLISMYEVDETTRNTSRWSWRTQSVSVGEILYDDSLYNNWIIDSSDAFLLLTSVDPIPDDRYPPHSMSLLDGVYTTWTDLQTFTEIELILICSCERNPITPPPTDAPNTPAPTPPPTNCTDLVVTSTQTPAGRNALSVTFYGDRAVVTDGRGRWTTADDAMVISYYDDVGRWSLYDTVNDETFLAPLGLSEFSEPESSGIVWQHASDPTVTYTLSIVVEFGGCEPTTTIPPPPLCVFPDNIVHSWPMSNLVDWTPCYFTTYSDGTTSAELRQKCLTEVNITNNGTLDDIYVFVGAIDVNMDMVSVGAYGHVSVLQTTTSSLTRAAQTSIVYPEETFWYNVPDIAFGFSDEQRIDLTMGGGSCDEYDLSSGNRLCWHLINADQGGKRAGERTDLNLARDVYKVVYYRKCNETMAPVACERIHVESAAYPLVDVLLNYAIVNNDKASWQEAFPPADAYEIGWLDVEHAWVFDTVSVDGKIWLHQPEDPTDALPPIDQSSEWYNQLDASETTMLYLSCNNSVTQPPLTLPPDGNCSCIEIVAPGLGGIAGHYTYSGRDNVNFGGVYSFVDDDEQQLYYDTTKETWLVVGNGAHFELDTTQQNTQLPPLNQALTFIDRDLDVTVTITLLCESDLAQCVPSECVVNAAEYIEAQFEYTSSVQFGFPVEATLRDIAAEPLLPAVASFMRGYDEFAYILNDRESVLQVAISDYVLEGSVTLTKQRMPPVTITAVYDSLDENVYRDSNTVGVWFQLFDALESTYIELSDAAVSIYAECPACTGSPTLVVEECDIVSVSNTTGANDAFKCELSVDESLFIKNTTNALNVWAELRLASDDSLIATSNLIELTLAPRIEAEGILFPGIFGEFAMSPRYATDEVLLTLWLNSDDWLLEVAGSKLYQKRYAQAWWMSIVFDTAVMSYLEFVPDDDIWGSIHSLYTGDESNALGEIEIWGSKIGQLLNTHGRNVSVGYFRFVVDEGVDAALYENVLSFMTLSMSGDNGYSIANDVDGYMADREGWYTTAASLQVIPDDPIDVFVEVNRNSLWNTAYFSGGPVSLPFPISVVYHFGIFAPQSVACTRSELDYSTIFFTSGDAAGCQARTTAYQTESGVAYIDITADVTASTAQKVNVWIPVDASFRVEPLNTGTQTVQLDLKQVDMAYRLVGDDYFESLPLYVYCQFELIDGIVLGQTGDVVINEFLAGAQQFVAADDTLVEVLHFPSSLSRYLLRGTATGATTLEFQLNVPGVSRTFVGITIGVGVFGNAPVNPLPLATIVGFGGAVITHAQFETDAIEISDLEAALPLNADLVSALSNADDVASVHAFMLLDDGVLIDLTDEVDIEYVSVLPDELRIDAVDKTNLNNMDLPGAFVTVTSLAQQRPWDTVIEYEWKVAELNGIAVDRVRGRGCIPAAIDLTQPLNISVSLSCDTTLITRIGDPANYIFGIPVECYLIVLVYWEDGTVTDMSRDNRTNYNIVTPNQLLILEDKNLARANRSCDIYTQHGVQNPDCYGSDIIKVNFTNYTALETWSGTVEIEVVIFDRLTLDTLPAPYFDNTSYQDPTLLNKFYCSAEYQRAQFEVFGNLTDGQWRELTDRSDVQLDLDSATPAGSAEVDNAARQIEGLATGTSLVQATLAGYEVDPAYRDNYYSNLEEFTVSDEVVTMTGIDMYTFGDRAQVFEELIDTRELLKIDVTFSDGVIIKDVLREMLMNGLWSDIAVSDVFTFTSTDPNVVSVSDDGHVTILDNWWREVNITVDAQCGPDVVAAQELIYPNLKPDLWDVDVEAPFTSTGLQFSNKAHDGVAESGEFLWNIYINATNGTLLSFSLRLYYDDTLFVENGTSDCSYFWNVWNGHNNSVDSWPQCYAAGDWEGQMMSWNLDTVRGELRLAGASSKGSSTNSSLQHVATCNFRVDTETEQNISMVAGQVIEITYIDDADQTVKHVYDRVIVAGDGYQQINQGVDIKPEFQPNVQARYLEERNNRNYTCTAQTDDEIILMSNIQAQSAGYAHCCDYDLFGDANYDCRHTAWDAQVATLYFIDTTDLAPFNSIALDDLSTAQRMAMDESLDYLQTDRNECADETLTNPCPNGLEDVWYKLQVTTGKFLHMNVSYREQTLYQQGRTVHGIAPMFIQEYANEFRLATDQDATVYFELKNVSVANRDAFIGNNSLTIGTYLPSDSIVYNNYNNDDNFESFRIENTSILIQGEYVEGKYWTFVTEDFDWQDDDCFEMAILYQTYDEDGNCTQIDREYAFRGSKYYGDSFIEFTELCIFFAPTPPPTPHPTRAPTYEKGIEVNDCRYEDHGTAILFYFNADTNRAGFGGEPFACLSVFTPPSFQTLEGVTFDSRCIWKDFRTIRIELGNDFRVRPTWDEQSYYLELSGNNVRDYDENFGTVKGYCIVYPMFNPPPVWANVIGRTQLSACDDLTLSATPSKGQAPPMKWKWELLGNLDTRLGANGCSLLEDSADKTDTADDSQIVLDGETLFIPRACLSNLQSLDINLNVTNHYFENFNYPASTHSIGVSVARQSNAQQLTPTVELLAPQILNITNEQDLVVPTFVYAYTDSGCAADGRVYDLAQFTFRWFSLGFDDLTDLEEFNPFGTFLDFVDIRLGRNYIEPANFQSVDIAATSTSQVFTDSPTLIVPGNNFQTGNYYAFGVEVTYDGRSSVAYVGVIVNLPIPYPRPSTKYVSILEGDDVRLNVFDLYEFYGFSGEDDLSALYGIEWDCFHADTNVTILDDASVFDDQQQIVVNAANAAMLSTGGMYNCSAHLYSKERSTFAMTWGRQESYVVFEYLPQSVVQSANSSNAIGVFMTSNIGTISRNKRIVISASMVDYVAGLSTAANGAAFDGYQFEWTNFGENSDVDDAVYGISAIDHVDYEHNYTVNFVVDDEVNRFIYDGQKLGFQLKVTNVAGGYSGYGQFELIANRGPNGGVCKTALYDERFNLFRVECTGWTDEYMEVPLQYNWMLLSECYTDADCKGELVCDVEQSEYDVGVCVLTTLANPVQNYLREWTSGNIHYFSAQCDTDESYIVRSYVRDYSGFVTSFDSVLDTTAVTNEAYYMTVEDVTTAQNARSTNAFSSYIATFDSLADCIDDTSVYERTPLALQILDIYNGLLGYTRNDLYDKFYDFNKIYSTVMDAVFYDYTQFDEAVLDALLADTDRTIADISFEIVADQLQYYKEKRDGLYGKMIPRDLSVYELTAMTWAGDASHQQTALRSDINTFNTLKNVYFNRVMDINELGLYERLIDETHYNVSYAGTSILSGWETKAKLFSDDSDCGGDVIDFGLDFEVAYFGGEEVDYVKCELIQFNGGILSPTKISTFMSSPIMNWNFRGFKKDGTEVPIGGFDTPSTGRRRLPEFDDCTPFIYTIYHNPNTSLKSYDTRRSDASSYSQLTWSVCKTILNLGGTDQADRTGDEKLEDIQAPTAEDCYVLTHDETKTVCACNSNYTLLAVEEETYIPVFRAQLTRFDPPFTWLGLMESVAAVLWLLILFFVFTFAFYVLPSYDKHKALLAVKKGLPASQREGAYFKTAEGKVYRAARINMNSLSFCQVYGACYLVRLRNDHMCMWMCCDDPGSNISHFTKVSLSFMYCLLFMWQLAWFYGNEFETVFPCTLFAFLIAFETILPIWLCAWCVSKIRPHEFTEEEIQDMVDEQQAKITKNQEWEHEYESDDADFGEEEAEVEEGDGYFAPPTMIDNSLKERGTNADIKRVYTDIDEEVEYLEENYMPVENTWAKKKRKAYDLYKVGYAPLEDTNHEHSDSVSSLDSREERRGFEDTTTNTHWMQARDAATLGFVPVNENEEFDEAASKMLHKEREQNLKEKRKKKKKHGHESSLSQKISSIFRSEKSQDRSKSTDQSETNKKKKKKDKKRKGSQLSQLLSFGSKRNVAAVATQDSEDEDLDAAVADRAAPRTPQQENDDERSYQASSVISKKKKKYAQLDNGSDENEEDEDEDYFDDEDQDYYDDDEENAIVVEDKKSKKKKKDKDKKKKQPTVSSMNAPRPRPMMIEMEEQEREKPQFSSRQKATGEYLSAQMIAPRKYVQFAKIVKIGRIHASKIGQDSKMLSRIVDNAITAGDYTLYDSQKIVKRATKLIRNGHPLFDAIESGATAENQNQIQKLLRRQDVINTVFAPVDDGTNVLGLGGPKFAYDPAELRALEELPETAPSQRPHVEKETNIDDDVWEQSNLAMDGGVALREDKDPNKHVDASNQDNMLSMEDIWNVTGALPPELLQTLEDPFDAWRKDGDEVKPVQKPMRDDEEQDYRDKLGRHFRRRRELLHRKYWLPRWCRYVVWLIVLLIVVLMLGLFLYDGNKLGATFLWVPEPWDNTNCTLSISEQTRFDYDYSLDEADRRNPACSPQEILGSMPHCWDYRVRFTISSFITFLTSVLIVQPLYIAILTLLAVTCFPIFAPCCISIRNTCLGLRKNDPGYKHFLGGTILLSGDQNLEYGRLADEEFSHVPQNSSFGVSDLEMSQVSNDSGRNGSTGRNQPLLKDK